MRRPTPARPPRKRSFPTLETRYPSPQSQGDRPWPPNLTPGRDADFVVIDLFASPLLARRMGRTQSLAEELFTLMMLGDDRAIYETWTGGRLQHRRQT